MPIDHDRRRDSTHTQFLEKALHLVFLYVRQASFLQRLACIRGYEDILECAGLSHAYASYTRNSWQVFIGCPQSVLNVQQAQISNAVEIYRSNARVFGSFA